MAQHKDHVWSCDFVSDKTEDARKLRFLAIMDEYTRECLPIEVRRHFRGRAVVDVLQDLFAIRDRPKRLRSDNGPEFASKAVRTWLKRQGVGTLFIEPGSPWENAYAESFNGKLRDGQLGSQALLRIIAAEESPAATRQTRPLPLRPDPASIAQGDSFWS